MSGLFLIEPVELTDSVWYFKTMLQTPLYRPLFPSLLLDKYIYLSLKIYITDIS